MARQPTCACPIRSAAAASRPYHDRADLNDGGPHEHVDAIARHRRRRMDGFVASAESGRRRFCRGTSTLRAARLAEEAGRDGLPHGEARSRTTGATRGTSSSRTTCSSRRRRGACRRTSTSSPAGRRSARSAAIPTSCVNAVQAPGSPPGEPQTTRRRDPRLRVDRPHLSAAPSARHLALLRLQGPAARLRRRRDVLQADHAEREDARASGTRCRASTRSSRTASSTTSRPFEEFLTAARSGTLPAVSWVVPCGRGQRASAGARRARPDVRHERGQRGHAQPRLELDRDLPRLGRLGRLLRPREAAGRRRERLRPARARRS